MEKQKDKNGQVIVVTSGKGGVGKTTTTANIGCSLALLGNKVVMIDADIGLRNLDVVMGLESRVISDIIDVVKNNTPLKNALIKDKRVKGLFLLAASQSKDKTAISPKEVQQLTTQLRTLFDYILIDSPAGIEQGFKNAIAGADKAIIVITPEVSAVRDADRVIGLLNEEQIADPLLIINRIRGDMVRKGNMMNTDDIVDILRIDLLGVLPDDEDIIISTNRGEPIALNDNSFIANSYRNIAKRVIGEYIPIEPIENTDSIFKRILNFFRGI